jgi:guanylate kinase
MPTSGQPSGVITGRHLVVLSGPSGAGKTSVARALPARMPDLAVSLSATTRGPRPGEKDGVDYYFIDKAEFQKRVAEGRFAEWAEVFGQFYGTPLEELERACRSGRILLLEIDVQGGILIKRKYPEALAILLLPPDPQALRARLLKRGTEAPEEAQKRFDKAQEEIRLARQSQSYDVEIVNDRLEDAIAEVITVIQTRRNQA